MLRLAVAEAERLGLRLLLLLGVPRLLLLPLWV